MNTVVVSWCAASCTSPSPVATTVEAISTTRRDRVRTNIGTASRPTATRFAGCSPSPIPSRRARRTITASSTSAMPHWAMSVPIAEPAIPRPAPKISSAFSGMFTIAPLTATTSGSVASCSPRTRPVAACTASMAGRPRALMRR